MELPGSRQAIRERHCAGGPPLAGEFNSQAVVALADRIEASLAKRPPAAG